MDFAKRFWKSIFSEKEEVLRMLFYKFGFRICPHNCQRGNREEPEEKAHLRDACKECVLNTFENILRLKVMINLKCLRNMPKEGEPGWTIGFFPFVDEDLHVDLYSCGVEMQQLMLEVLARRKMVPKRPDLFGNCIEFENFSYDVEVQFFGVSKHFFFLLGLVFILHEIKLSRNVSIQRNVVDFILRRYVPLAFPALEIIQTWTVESILKYVGAVLESG